ncbi:MAG: LuxR family transcriptional regulator [Pseudolabrys sp.]
MANGREPFIDAFIERTRRARSDAQLKSLFMEAIRKEGYENVAFASTINRQLDYIVWDEFPEAYLPAYKDRRWDKIDPVLKHVEVARKPFRWFDVIARRELTRRQHQFLNECKELGVHSGVTFPLHGPGSRVDLISLSLRNESKVSPERLPYLHSMAVQVWIRHHEMTGGRSAAKSELVHLTNQELACLNWCKAGMTNWEIGERLNVSEKTIEWHFGNIMRKLGASNRMTAVVIALQKGLISLA